MAFATLGGHTVTRAVVMIPAWGACSAVVSVDVDELVTGTTELVLGELTLVCTVVPDRGGAFAGAGEYLLVGGAGGWGKTLDGRAYQSDAGVRLSTVAQDVAREVGERIVIADEVTLGTSCTRMRRQAARLLSVLVGPTWWVAPDGTTHVGPRDGGKLPDRVEVLDYSPARARAIVAAEAAIVETMPGKTILGREVASVVHTIDGGSLSTEVWLR